MVSRIYTKLVSECCNALPWHLEVYDSLGICSKCKDHSSFISTSFLSIEEEE